MTTVRLEAQVSPDDLLKAVGQLSLPELDRFVHNVISLQAQAKAPSLSHAEAELLLKINQGLPHAIQRRYAELIDKRRAEALSYQEHDELLHLTDQVEQLEAQRVEALAELARLRQTSLVTLMDSLGIRTPSYA